MKQASTSGKQFFGPFTLDTAAGELRKHGVRLKVGGQPLEILRMLLERPGVVITREELRAALWAEDTFVDFDHSLNAAVNKLREALGDSAENPRYVETLPRRGYRFVGQLQKTGVSAGGGATATVEAPASSRPWGMVLGLLAVVVLAVAVVGFNVGGVRDRVFGSPAEVLPPVRSLAVLPFANLSNDAEQEYFVDGMTEELISQLARVKALRVVSRTSAMRYKQTAKALPEIGRELNVQAVVEGSVLRVGDKVRISAQLVDAATDQHLWAQTYEGDLRDILGLHSEVARAIAREVRINLSPQEEGQLAARRAVNPQAHEAYLKGQFYLSRGNALKTMQELKKAIELDPTFAPAYAALAEQYVFTLPSLEKMPLAREAALKAIELDESNAEAHMVLALVRLYFDWDWPGAEKEFQRAIELDPGSATVHSRYIFYLWTTGRFKEAIASAERARELDPLNIIVNTDLGRSYYFDRQFDRAIAQFRKTMELDSNNRLTFLFYGIACEQRGDLEEAAKAIARSLELANAREQADALRRAYDSSGFKGFLRAWAEAWALDVPRGRAQPYSVGILHARLGENDKAFQWLEKALQERSRAMVYLNAEPQFDLIRDDPRFKDLARRMGLPEIPRR